MSHLAVAFVGAWVTFWITYAVMTPHNCAHTLGIHTPEYALCIHAAKYGKQP